MHDGDDTWTALEQVDWPSGSSTCGGGERQRRPFHFNAPLPVVDRAQRWESSTDADRTCGGGSQGSQGVRTCHPGVKRKRALLNEPI